MTHKFNLKFIAVFLITAQLFLGCASGSSSQQNAKTQSELEDDEIVVGRQIHSQITALFLPYTHSKVVAYINEVGYALTPHAKRKGLRYTFTILNSDKIYATSAPGGYIYITTGMIHFLRTEAELAAVLAHEIGELQYKDPRLSQMRKNLTSVTKTGAAIGPLFGQIGALAVVGLVLMNAVIDVQEKTMDERLLQADLLALGYLLKSGYDPQALTDVLYHFLNAQDRITPYFYDYYQLRPISEERVRHLSLAFSKLDLSNKELITRPRVFLEETKPIREMYAR